MNSADRIENEAKHLLEELGLRTLPIPVERVAQRLGLEIQETLFGDEISGVLVVRGGAGTIGVNADHALVRRRFTIAHEIGHFVLHHEEGDLFIDHRKPSVFLRDSNSSTGERRKEVEANAFAASLLMPRAQLLERLSADQVDVFDDDSIQSLAELFGVSTQALLLRLAKLGLLEVPE